MKDWHTAWKAAAEAFVLSALLDDRGRSDAILNQERTEIVGGEVFDLARAALYQFLAYTEGACILLSDLHLDWKKGEVVVRLSP